MSRKAAPVDDSQALVNEMRMLALAPQVAPVEEQRASDEQAACRRVTTVLMLLLVFVLFITSALPDLLPRLTHVLPAGL
ncbi:MAG TPA: hypothetical protein VET65_13215 [Candidatus Limnocylindrales bacterium]|nr:hypothetical protein [Candidatus Limnocylindrales bacterium]